MEPAGQARVERRCGDPPADVRVFALNGGMRRRRTNGSSHLGSWLIEIKEHEPYRKDMATALSEFRVSWTCALRRGGPARMIDVSWRCPKSGGLGFASVSISAT